MVQFGRNPNPGTILQAGSFLAEELPIRLAHRVKELDELPHDLSNMPSIVKVKNWYAQSFEELINFPKPSLPESVQKALQTAQAAAPLPESTPNPSLLESAALEDGPSTSSSWSSSQVAALTSNGAANGMMNGRNGIKKRALLEHRYYANLPDQNWPPEIQLYNEEFTRALEKIKKRHDAVVTTIAQGVLEYKRARKAARIQADVQSFLDRFYMSRIGIRILIGQHIALSRTAPNAPKMLEDGSRSRSSSSSAQLAARDGKPEPEQYVGIICTNTNVGAMAHEAIENARFVCEEHYGLFKGPPVQLVCPSDLTFMYVPSHLNHMLFELLKNSLRAVVERYGVENEDNFPPIKVIVVEGKEDITIKISDEGGGIARSEMPLVWTYMYTTAQSEDLDPEFSASDFKAPMAGFGYGLPLARLYARYFGGDLKLISMEGYGTDVYLHLNRLSSSSEPLP